MASDQTSLVLLGSTGSIGVQTLKVVRDHPGQFRVLGMASGGSNLELLAQQIVEFQPQVVAMGNGEGQVLENLLSELGMRSFPQIDVGQAAVESMAGGFSGATVLNGITGGIGLGSTLRALENGNIVALANKESLVVGGHLVRQAMRFPGQIVPVDSEHSAIAQALLAGRHEKGLTSLKVTGRSELLEIILTASGGPFRGKTRAELANVTVGQAMAHPTWAMGPVVTINSSTLMNKGLELIEAAILFDVSAEQIVPVVHPQSIVHSMVTWQDGSSIAQASTPNMEVPISLGLSWPIHRPAVGIPLKWADSQAWTFEPVDNQVFPAIDLAKRTLLASPTHPAVLNAANEVCVEAFIQGRLPWLGIVDTVAAVVAAHQGIGDPSRDDIDFVQAWATRQAQELITKQGN